MCNLAFVVVRSAFILSPSTLKSPSCYNNICANLRGNISFLIIIELFLHLGYLAFGIWFQVLPLFKAIAYNKSLNIKINQLSFLWWWGETGDQCEIKGSNAVDIAVGDLDEVGNERN